MAESVTLNINGGTENVQASPDTPLLYVLIDDLQLQGPRFGCGLAQCGACSILVDGLEMRSCVTPLSAVQGRSITTLEGLPAEFARQHGLQTVPELSPVQEAMVEEQALQCGYCFNGMIIKATELLATNTSPTTAQIRRAMNGHLCRCGTYPRIISAIHRAAEKLRSRQQGETV